MGSVSWTASGVTAKTTAEITRTKVTVKSVTKASLGVRAVRNAFRCHGNVMALLIVIEERTNQLQRVGMTVVQFPINFNVKAGVVLPWLHYVMEFRTAMIFQMKSYAIRRQRSLLGHMVRYTTTVTVMDTVTREQGRVLAYVNQDGRGQHAR